MTQQKISVDLIVIENLLEAIALRSILEYWQVQVNVIVHDPEASSHPFFQVLFLEEGAGGKEGFIYFDTVIASNDGASILST